MIQPQELRIGNCVTINNPNSWIELLNIPMIVTGIDFSMTKKEKEIWAHSNGKIRVENGYNTYSQFSQFIDPIPLTEEILLNFGFEKEGGYLSIGKLRGAITVCKAERESDSLCYRWFINNLKMTDLHFVHQLQNLYFALTGEELKYR